MAQRTDLKRNYKILKMALEGSTFVQIGKEYGITPQRVRTICIHTCHVLVRTLPEHQSRLLYNADDEYGMRVIRPQKDLWLPFLK